VLSLVEELIDLARLENPSDAIDEWPVDLDYLLRDAWRCMAWRRPDAAPP
jgi:hypothetical protein